MEIKEVQIGYLPDVMFIINEAKNLLKKDSLQWQQGYPNDDTMKQDILSHRLYGIFEGNQLLGIEALVLGLDENYVDITNGSWNKKASSSDLVIHRIAVHPHYHKKHIGTRLIEFAIQKAQECLCSSIKADTHKKNVAMQKILKESGFEYRGIIFLKRDEIDNSRLAFEYVCR